MAIRSRHFSGNQRITQASHNRPVMRRGESGDGVRLLQEALLMAGYPMPISAGLQGEPDGIFGTETDTVVRIFQTREGLSSDGLAGRNTLRRLDELMCEQEAAANKHTMASNWEMSTARNTDR